MFHYRCSYKIYKQNYQTKEQGKLQEEIKKIKAEREKTKKDNDIRINTLSKGHLDELEDQKRENCKLNKSINDLRETLALEKPKEGKALLKTLRKVDTESESNVMTK